MPSDNVPSSKEQNPRVPGSYPSEEGGDVDFRTSRQNGRTVAIVGGGLAGLAAGCVLSSSGFKVTLFERRPYLGGRASSYEHPGTGEVVDNCQHVLFKLCTNLIDFYRKIGIEDKIRWLDRMTFIEPGGRQSVLKPSIWPAPFSVMPSFLGFKFLGAKDKFALGRALASIILGSPKDDGRSFQEWLIRHRQTPAAIERFWKPILVSALSEDLDRVAVPYAAQVVRESMRSRDARLMGVPTVPLTELYNAARDFIVQRGGEVRMRSSVQSFEPFEDSASKSGVSIKLQDSEERFDCAVIAVPFDSLSKLLPSADAGSPGVANVSSLREKLSHLETSPITGVHFWFDRQVTDLPHAVLLDRTIQWMFHKSLLLCFQDRPNTPSASPSRAEENHSLANDSVQSGDLRLKESGSYVELVISSSKSLINKSRQEIVDLALAELREFFPGARGAQLVKATVIKEVNATFSPKPGVDQFRPAQKTHWPSVFLSGDWTATGWPATMESAVRSGYLAAEAVTAGFGSAGRFVVPDLSPGGFMKLIG
jgi:squalene-associated FAD-dependent desaturase